MSDALLGYYMRELAYLREQGVDFARQYPKIAGRLRLGPDQSDDPMVAPLVESIAFLNARIRHKLDDDFPEIAEAMLNVLYPHYLRPVPTMAVVQCTVNQTQGGLTGGYTIPRGTMIESEPIDGEPCRFRTGYPLTLWPIRLVMRNWSGVPSRPCTPHHRTQAGSWTSIWSARRRSRRSRPSLLARSGSSCWASPSMSTSCTRLCS